jgi:anti-anti-sigma factor
VAHPDLTRARYDLQAVSQLAVTLQERDPPLGIVTLLGEHDAFSSTRLENELAVLVDGGLGTVVDLREATFIDSQTLSVLLAARHRAEEAALGYTVVLPEEGGNTQVHRLLDLTGLKGAFAVYPSVAAASSAARDGVFEATHVRTR